MSDMHPTMQRLYAAAAALEPPLTRQVEIASALNESSQRINNWEARGISKEGAILAQRYLGVSATHILDGLDPVFIFRSQPVRISAETMAAAWRMAGLVSAQTTGSAALAMPRDAELVAQAINAIMGESESEGGYGQGAGTTGKGRQPASETDVGKEGAPARRRTRQPAKRGPKLARSGSA